MTKAKTMTKQSKTMTKAKTNAIKKYSSVGVPYDEYDAAISLQYAFIAGHKDGAIEFAKWILEKDWSADANWKQLYEQFNNTNK